jgi:ABC-type glutathione transport system ATPase component
VLEPVKQLIRGVKLAGRAAELEALLPALREHRIASIWGGAGEGKSRLAYELLVRLHEEKSGGVRFDKVLIAELGALHECGFFGGGFEIALGCCDWAEWWVGVKIY